MLKNKKTIQDIFSILVKGNFFAVSEIYDFISKKDSISLVTVKRLLSKMVTEEILIKVGKGRGVKYQLSTFGRLNFEIDATEYCKTETDKRFGLNSFNFFIFDNIISIFDNQEVAEMNKATNKYNDKTKNVSETLHKKELERFIIELSWKSSKIEGNTYTLLDTERLLNDGIEATGKTRDEAIMIINHKKAFDFIYQHRDLFKDISVSKIEEVHKILVKDLGVINNLRSKPVGILGSKYRPLDNSFQIREAMEKLCTAISKLNDSFSKALLLIAGISYIQPFEDGNKRTSRLLGNAILLAYGSAPLSYRMVDEEKYREAIMVFYELNSIVPLKRIFFDQYIFSTENYLV